jgi:nicotinamidase-related amidase
MRTALLVIDLQKDFLAQLPDDRATAVVTAAGQLVEAARKAGASVIWVMQRHKADLSDAMLEIRDRKIAVVIEGTPGAELADGLEPLPTESVIVKKRYSAFFGTDLDDQLAERGVERVVIAGLNTHACVRMAAIDAYQRDLRVVIAREAIDGNDLEHGAVTLRYFDGKIAELCDLETAVKRLEA